MINIPIFLASDDNYAPFVGTTIASICENTKSFCDFYILDSGISDENKAVLADLQKHYTNFSIEFVNVNPQKYFAEFIASGYLSVATYNRFLIADLYPNLNRVLYLDVDIIVSKDIKELFEKDIEDFCLGAIPDQGDPNYVQKLKQNLDMNQASSYFNAGILLLDLQKWRAQNIREKLFAIERQYRGKLLCNDQDILNKCFENNYKQLGMCYNAMYPTNDFVIRHYFNKIKPWMLKPELCVGAFADFGLFWSYARKLGLSEKLEAKCKYTEKRQLPLLRLLQFNGKM